MNEKLRKYGLVAIKGLLTLAFAAAGVAKLAGAEQMIAVYETLGIGQWFRHVTGVIEVASAIALWIPGIQAFAAGTLVATMIGAALAHLLILGPSVFPALVLGVLATIVLYGYREQVTRLVARNNRFIEQ